LISALVPLPNGSSAQIFTDSPRLYCHVMGLTHVRDAELAALLLQVRRLIKWSGLKIDLRCTSPGKNLARRLLQPWKRISRSNRSGSCGNRTFCWH
jgi:hypothetical protein